MKINLAIIFILLVLIKNVTMLYWHRDHGVNNQSFKFLVVGGYRPEKHEMGKYMVSLQGNWEEEDFGTGHFCGGTIIKPDVILTAAHCVCEKNVISDFTDYRVLAGTVNRLEKIATTEEIEIKEVLVYPYYHEYSLLKNDLALLKLKREITIDGKTRAVINIVDRPVANTKCLIAGWGNLYFEGPMPAEIVYADLFVLSAEHCKQEYPHFYRKGMLCVHDDVDLDKSSCNGDSGGPLFCDNTIVGIASFGRDCTAVSPTVYTDVHHYREWILANFALRQNISKDVLVCALIISLKINCIFKRFF